MKRSLLLVLTIGCRNLLSGMNDCELNTQADLSEVVPDLDPKVEKCTHEGRCFVSVLLHSGQRGTFPLTWTCEVRITSKNGNNEAALKYARAALKPWP